MRTRTMPVGFLAVLAFWVREVAAQEDPGALGPIPLAAVSEYQGSNVVLGSPPVAVETLGRIHRPSSLVGSYPLVLFLHGQHRPCYVVATNAGSDDWPCTNPGLAPVPSYRGYDYVAQILASRGMIVASISSNGINAAKEVGTAIEHRRLLLQHHVNAWATANSTGGGVLGNSFIGKVDMSRIATVGHSRGGQAVLNYAITSPPSGLRAVLAIAPSGTGLFTPLTNIPLAILLGYCDGDLFNLNGFGFVDEARYADATDQADKYTFLGLDANHNYFNSAWGPSSPTGGDDWDTPTDAHCGSSARLSEAEQQGFGKAYMAAFLRKHLLGENQFDGILNGDALPPPSAQTTQVFIGYLPRSSERKDLNRLFTSSEALTTNTLGGTVSRPNLLVTPCGSSPKCVSADRSTHWPSGGLEGAIIEWTGTNGIYSNGLPLFQRDVSNFITLQFRVAIDYTNPENSSGDPQDFRIRLTDSGGTSVTVTASDYSDVLYYPPGDVIGSTDNRAAVMNTLRVPLDAFADVDLTTVASVALLFDRTSSGSVVLSDMAFTDEGITIAEEWLAARMALF